MKLILLITHAFIFCLGLGIGTGNKVLLWVIGILGGIVALIALFMFILFSFGVGGAQ